MLLDILQDDIPLISDPWQVIGVELGIPGDEVLARITKLTDEGIIRGITPTLESNAGRRMVSTLCALRVDEPDLPRVVRVINGYEGVSHNFRREHRYNLWFTLAAQSDEAITQILSEILKATGLSSDDLLNLPTEQKYKIDVRFPIRQKNVSNAEGEDGLH